MHHNRDHSGPAMDFLVRLFGVAAAALAAAIATPVFAGAPQQPSQPSTVNWTGFYVGGDVGAVFNTTTFTQPGSGLQETSLGTIDGRPTYGVFTGFNYQVAPWAVLGLEGDFNWLSSAYYRELGSSFDFLQKSRFVDSVTARAGILARPDTLIYGKIGAAWLSVEGVQGFGTPFQRYLPGVQGGIGIEAMITPNVIARGEATYTYADTLTLNQGSSVYRPSILMMQVGLAYKFDPLPGWGVPATLASEISPVPVKNPMALKAPPPPAAPPEWAHWTGLEAGGFLSANGNQVQYNDTVLGQLGPFTDFKLGGGWFVGVNYKFWRIVVGVEGSGNYENANFQTAAGSGGLVNYYHFANIDKVLAFTGRAGFLMTPDTLIYGKAGPASFRMTPDPAYWNSIAPNSTGGTLFRGYVAGGGVETFVLPNVSVRFETLYTHTDDKVTLNGTVPNEFTLRPSIISATLGVGLHL